MHIRGPILVKLAQIFRKVIIVFAPFFGSLPAVLPQPWPLTIWPNQYAPRSGTYVKFGEISSNIYQDIVFTPFSGHCLLWPWLLAVLPRNLISTNYEPKYICGQNWVKFPPLVS